LGATLDAPVWTAATDSTLFAKKLTPLDSRIRNLQTTLKFDGVKTWLDFRKLILPAGEPDHLLKAAAVMRTSFRSLVLSEAVSGSAPVGLAGEGSRRLAASCLAKAIGRLPSDLH
jgi:hypothetical protein